MTTGICVMPHRAEPDRPRPALGGLRLCAGHHTALTDALTGPSPIDDPTIDAVWGVCSMPGSQVTLADDWRDAERLRASRATLSLKLAKATGATPKTHTVVCGDGETWLPPRDYRPGGLARDYTALATVLAGHPTAGGTPVSGTPERRLPIAEPVAETRVRIAGALASWARVHAEELKTTAPATTSPAVLCAWLARYIDWAAARPWIDEYLGEILELRAHARALVDLPQPGRITVGTCVQRVDGSGVLGRVHCQGVLTTRLRDERDERPSLIECDTCGTTWTTAQWLRLGERVLAEAKRDANVSGLTS